MKTVRAVDLFCGAGGTSYGLTRAADELGLRVDLLAVNHWQVAIATHSKNHHQARHLCETLDGVDPRKVIPGGKLDLLVASPECTHHSNARGGRPMSDQSRASAWHVVRWAEALSIRAIIVENVREFTSWGPIGSNGRPLKSRRGETFQAFLNALRSLNYAVDYRILNAADYGDPTTRERLFVIARKGNRPIRWPEASHARDAGPDLFGTRKPWRAAREIIEWDKPGDSIFTRKRPLSPNTLRRIAAGMRKFAGLDLEPFLVKLYGTSTAASVKAPAPTVTGSGQHLALAEPFLLQQQSGGAPRSTAEPAPTIAGKGAISKVEPFLVPFFGEREGQEPRTHSVNGPAPAVTSHGAGGLVEPYLIRTDNTSNGTGKFRNGNPRPRKASEPVPTITGNNAFGLTEPYLIEVNHGGAKGKSRKARKTDEPLPTVTGKNGRALVDPFLVEFHGGPGAEKRTKSIGDPLPTQTCEPRFGLADAVIVGAGGPTGAGKPQGVDEPIGTVLAENHRGLAGAYLVQYNGTADAKSVDQPIGALTGKPRYALVEIADKRYLLDIRFRMLTPRELARAQGFPDDYEFTGTKADIVKQIGNAVPVNLAAALCRTALS